MVHRQFLARAVHLAWLAAAALLLASCSRSLPTAPIAPPSTGGPAARAQTADLSDQVVVTIQPGTDAARLAADYGLTLLDQHDSECSLQVPAGSAATFAGALAGDSRVATSEPNAFLDAPEARQESFAFDDGNGAPQTYLEQPAGTAIQLDAAHRVSRGAGIKVAVLDTGIDPAHPAFAGRIAGGWDFVDNDADPTDVQNGVDDNGNGVADEAWGHGTHVAGIVALTAPDASLLVVRVLDADGRGDVLSVASGIRWAVANGARVINLSLGMLRESPAVKAAIGFAESHRVVVVSAAGNWGAEVVEFPAADEEVDAVAATDATLHPAPFTSYGDFVALAAPGVGVRSAYPGGGYRLWSGTSMSSPFVAGTAALILAQHPDWSPDQVRQQLRSVAVPLVGVSADQVGKLGTGMLNAAAAVGVGPGLLSGDPPPDTQPIEILP